MAVGEDPPIIVLGGPHMINVEIRGSSENSSQRENFSIAPIDPAVPFKTIVITDGAKEVFRWLLSEDWKITIV